MQIYLPIAELPVNIFLILGLGGMGGILAGMFGIGGGFLITPLLIFIGVPPSVAVATSTNQIIASSFSGFLAHLYRNNVDIKMGIFLMVGGVFGADIGVRIFTFLESLGQIDIAISIIYVVFLGFIGTLMAVESSRTIIKQKKSSGKSKNSGHTGKFGSWIKSINLPMKAEFHKSELEISIFLPIIIGVLAGIMVSLMGIGGGFVMIPAMIYVLGMPTSVVVGTSLFQIVFITSIVTVLHSVNTQSVDIVLAFLLIIGGVIGAQFGTVIGLKLPAEKLRGLLAIIVLAVCIKLGLGLFIEPDELYTIKSVMY